MRQREVPCRVIVRGHSSGPLLVSSAAINFYLTDPASGKVIEAGHPLENQSVAGKIVIFPAGKGSSVVQVDGLYQLKMNGNLPAGLIARKLDPVLVSAAFITEVPLVTGVQDDLSDVGPHTTITIDSAKSRIVLSEP